MRDDEPRPLLISLLITGTREEPGTLTQGAPVFPGSSRLGIEPRTGLYYLQLHLSRCLFFFLVIDRAYDSGTTPRSEHGASGRSPTLRWHTSGRRDRPLPAALRR